MCRNGASTEQHGNRNTETTAFRDLHLAFTEERVSNDRLRAFMGNGVALTTGKGLLVHHVGILLLLCYEKLFLCTLNLHDGKNKTS